MKRASRVIGIGVIVSAVLAIASGCNGDSENYAAKDKAFELPANITKMNAAGSTFLGPLFLRWSSDYEKGPRYDRGLFPDRQRSRPDTA